jgi:hypothetical protein
MEYGPEVRQAILDRLASGESLSEICRDKEMPSRETVRLWQNDDKAFDLAVTRAREDGFEQRAVDAVRKAQSAEDAAKARLAFDAERWYLGKLSNAFSDNKPQEHKVEHGLSDEVRRWLGIG